MRHEFTANLNNYKSKPSKIEAGEISMNMHTVYVDSLEYFLQQIELGMP